MSARDALSIRVMTWNLLWRFGTEWRERQPLIRAVLDAQAPDIVGLQEVWADAAGTQADELGELLGMEATFASPSFPEPPDPPKQADHVGVEAGVAILSRWPIAASREYRLPSGHRPYVVALAATVTHPTGPLHVVTSCLDWAAEGAVYRTEQARALLAIASESRRDGPLTVFVLGDMNSPPSAPEIRPLADSMLDAWIVAARTDPPDGDGVTLSSQNPLASRDSWLIDQRIDYAFVRPGSPESPIRIDRTTVIRDAPGALPASDHYAVVADVSATHR